MFDAAPADGLSADPSGVSNGLVWGFRPSPIMKTMDIHDEAAPKDLGTASASGACASDG